LRQKALHVPHARPIERVLSEVAKNQRRAITANFCKHP